MLYNSRFTATLLLTLAVIALFGHDFDVASDDVSRRVLKAADGDHRELQAYTPAPTPPPGTKFSCGPGQIPYKVDWRSVDIEDDVSPQILKFPAGPSITLSVEETAPGRAHEWGLTDDGDLYLTAGTTAQGGDDIQSDGVNKESPAYPTGYATMKLEFSDELKGLYISISDVDSGKKTSDAVRIRMKDAKGTDVPVSIAKTGFIEVVDNYAFQPRAKQSAKNPGYEASLYAKAEGAVKSISLDQSVYFYPGTKAGKFRRRTIFPGLDISYCADPVAAEPTDAPVAPSIPSPTVLDVIEEAAGVTGDPLIMGLGGQLFKFSGRSGAWYSAVSTKSFQWNMKIQQYEKCPSQQDEYITGVGFTFFGTDGSTQKMIEVAVANPYSVNTGCGSSGQQNCLGAGSLEILIDGVKTIIPGYYKFPDSSGSIVAYNSPFECTRKWYDFDVSPAALSYAESRRLQEEKNAFDIIGGLKKTMVHPKMCDEWLDDRKSHNDLFLQGGRLSTVVVQTRDITFHIQYKQQMELCKSHSIDVWISDVSGDLVGQQWEGVIGETKASGGKKGPQARIGALKYDRDEAYEVNSPFSVKCPGCAQRDGE